MQRRTGRATLRRLELTEVVASDQKGAVAVEVATKTDRETYHVRALYDAEANVRVDGAPRWSLSTIPLYPVVLNPDGSPWPEANMCICDSVMEDFHPDMSSYAQKATDLAVFKLFCEQNEIDWLNFPKFKLSRPTYRFKAHLFHEIEDGKLSAGTANRRMRNVVWLYRKLIEGEYIELVNPPWTERSISVSFSDGIGRRGSKQVKSIDLRIKENRQPDPYSDKIIDGGKLKPLTVEQQNAVIEALDELANTEMRLICLSSLQTAGRIQTILTLRNGHFKVPPSKIAGVLVAVACGPGTLVDTKQNKRGVNLVIPKSLYVEIYTYLKSERYRKRAEKSPRGTADDQHVFLSQRGHPFYDSKLDINSGLLRDDVSSAKTGQGVRKFMTDRLIPLVRKKLKDSNFSFQFHDFRASFGINYLNYSQPKIDSGEMKRLEVLEALADLMWHSNVEMAERYVSYRNNVRNEVRQANERFFSYQNEIIERVLQRRAP